MSRHICSMSAIGLMLYIQRYFSGTDDTGMNTGEQNIQKDESAPIVGIIVASASTVGVGIYLGVKFDTFVKAASKVAKLFTK